MPGPTHSKTLFEKKHPRQRQQLDRERAAFDRERAALRAAMTEMAAFLNNMLGLIMRDIVMRTSHQTLLSQHSLDLPQEIHI